MEELAQSQAEEQESAAAKQTAQTPPSTNGSSDNSGNRDGDGDGDGGDGGGDDGHQQDGDIFGLFPSVPQDDAHSDGNLNFAGHMLQPDRPASDGDGNSNSNSNSTTTGAAATNSPASDTTTPTTTTASSSSSSGGGGEGDLDSLMSRFAALRTLSSPAAASTEGGANQPLVDLDASGNGSSESNRNNNSNNSHSGHGDGDGDDSSPVFIEPEEFHRLLNRCLVVDLRARSEYLRANISSFMTTVHDINVPGNILRPGLSAEDVRATLTSDAMRKRFDDRNAYAALVLVTQDESTSTEPTKDGPIRWFKVCVCGSEQRLPCQNPVSICLSVSLSVCLSLRVVKK